jgi:hypothetical protein
MSDLLPNKPQCPLPEISEGLLTPSQGVDSEDNRLGWTVVLLLPTKLQCVFLKVFEGLLTLVWGIESEDHP